MTGQVPTRRKVRDSKRHRVQWVCEFAATIAVPFALSCSPTGSDPLSSDPSGQPLVCQPGSSVACTCSSGATGTAACTQDGSAYSACACSAVPSSPGAGVAGNSNSSSGSSGAPPVDAAGGSSGTSGTSSHLASDLPCEINAIVARNCQGCHASSPRFGATHPLISAADFQGEASSQVLSRVRDAVRPMPPAPNARISDADLAVLESWLNSGAPAGHCETPTAATDPLVPSSGATDPDEDVKCYSIVARYSSTGEKYPVPLNKDYYQCFEYDRPWGDEKVQLVSARPIIDNAAVLHHWILYNNTDAVVDGAHTSCGGAHPDAANIAGWAPGGEELHMPPDVGLRIEPGGFTLEMHYSNGTGTLQPDASGAEICVTSKLRKHEAAVHWLGTQNLNKLSATGTCEPSTRVPVTVISATPHMHLQGRHMSTIIHRVDGTTDTLLDVPFDFNSQVTYSTPAIVNPGDTLSTTCDYAMPTPFGAGTNQEMCYNFVIAYPAGGLAPDFQLFRKYNCAGF
ncbi:MAG TPA: hypothetical protein VFQ61_18795 [Polyangiaceae bacterium]|nr:hypothetical protein [Polyangiaceae bacterium]